MMSVTEVLRISSKCGRFLAIVCLALMVIALGAVAKHSQFESPSHSTHYLKQSVKMVSSSDHPAIVSVTAFDEFIAEFVAPRSASPQFAPLVAVAAVPSPLLL